MNRTQIYLNPAQQNLLRSIAEKQMTTLSDLIRQAIDFWLQEKKPSSKKHPLSGVVGLYHDPADSQGSKNHDDIYE